MLRITGLTRLGFEPRNFPTGSQRSYQLDYNILCELSMFIIWRDIHQCYLRCEACHLIMEYLFSPTHPKIMGVVQISIHMVAPPCKCTIVWAYIFIFVTVIYMCVYICYVNIYFTVRRINIILQMSPNESLFVSIFRKWLTSLTLSDNRGIWYIYISQW